MWHKFAFVGGKMRILNFDVTKIIVFPSVFERKVVYLQKIYKYQG